jgi:hypothetical protein
MFGGYLTYTFNRVTKKLVINRSFKNGEGEEILAWVDILKPEEQLLQDPYIGVWLQDFTLAELKCILGEARELYSSLPGPGGGTSLNGAAMKQGGMQDKERLFKDLLLYQDGGQCLTWVIG